MMIMVMIIVMMRMVINENVGGWFLYTRANWGNNPDCISNLKNSDLCLWCSSLTFSGNLLNLLVSEISCYTPSLKIICFSSIPSRFCYLHSMPLGGAMIQLVSLTYFTESFLICHQFIFIQTKGDHVKNIRSVDSL